MAYPITHDTTKPVISTEEVNQGESTGRVRRVLLSTARDLGPAGRDKDFGGGLADPVEALMSIGGKPGDALQAVRTPPQ